MRYNYFDDDEENEARELQFEEKLIELKSLLNPRNFISELKLTAHRLVDGEFAGEIKELPNLRNLLLKILAFVLFFVIVLVFILSFAHTISSQNKKHNQFSADAGKVCTEIITKHGTVKWSSLDRETYGDDKAMLTGLCYARQMDFDNDGSPELMVCYNNDNVYMLEVYSYIKKEFQCVYSEQANCTKNIKDGSWISFYRKNNKYYICKSEKNSPELVKLYALRGNEFKQSDECEYDYINGIYSFDGEINVEDFETIKLSVIRKSRAEYITEIVANNLEDFSTVSIKDLENKKSDAQLKKDAYYEIIEKRIAQYGRAEKKKEDGKEYIAGLAYVDLIDFNNDKNEELVIVFRKNLKGSATNYYTGESITIEVPTYCMEVYNWNGTIAKKIFSKESVSNYLDDTDVNYVMFKLLPSKTQICVNRYSYSGSQEYTATSKIYSLKKEKFNTIFNAKKEYSYGYSNYFIDNEYTYSSEFEEKGYKVPLFMDDAGKVDTSKYKIIYLSGKSDYSYDSIIENTTNTIRKINSSYSPK